MQKYLPNKHGRPEFESPDPRKNPGVVVKACDSIAEQVGTVPWCSCWLVRQVLSSSQEHAFNAGVLSFRASPLSGLLFGGYFPRKLVPNSSKAGGIVRAVVFPINAQPRVLGQ